VATLVTRRGIVNCLRLVCPNNSVGRRCEYAAPFWLYRSLAGLPSLSYSFGYLQSFAARKQLLVTFAMATVRKLGKLVASTALLTRRNKVLSAGILLMLGVAGVLAYLLAGCGGGSSTTPPPPPPPVTFQALTATEVTNIATAAAASVSTDTLVVAVVDRQGKVLGVFHKAGAPIGALSLGNFSVMENADDVAVELARTGAFFSNNQAPLTSRTVRFISGIHCRRECRISRRRICTELKTRIAGAHFRLNWRRTDFCHRIR